jgi:hypothetical protein
MINIQYGGFRTDVPIVPGATFTAGAVLVPTANGYTTAASSTQYSGHAYRIVDPNYNSSRRDVVGLSNTAGFGGPMVVSCDATLISGTVVVGSLLNTVSGSFVAVTSSSFGECIGVSNGIYTLQLY